MYQPRFGSSVVGYALVFALLSKDSPDNHSRSTIRWHGRGDASTGSCALPPMSLASLNTVCCLAAGEQDLQDQAGLDWDSVLEVVTTLVENNPSYQRQASNASWVRQCVQLGQTSQKLCLQLFLQASQE